MLLIFALHVRNLVYPLLAKNFCGLLQIVQAMANTNTSGDHLQSNNSDVLDVSTVRRNYATKLEQVCLDDGKVAII